MNKDMVIIERRLFSSFGHERTQIVAINELIGNNNAIVLTCNGQNLKKVPFQNKIYPELPEYDFKNEGKESLNYIKKNANALNHILEHKILNSRIKIIIPSARTLEIAMFTHLYKEKKIPSSFKVILRILDLNFLNNLSNPMLNEFCNLVKLNKITLLSETEELAIAVWDFFKIRCIGNFILPVTAPFSTNLNQSRNKKDEIYIGCLGGARKSKGFFTIPKIIKTLRKYFKINNEVFTVTFIVQLNKDKTKRSFIFKLNEFLSRYISSSVNVKYIYGTEDNIEFYELLKSIDIFLLPYSKESYKYCGSGFITDATLLEKPLITAQGLSMRNLLSFGNAISANSPEEYSSAIIKISKDYINYSEKSKLAKNNLKKIIRKSFMTAMCS
jgi:glycosyltransferase involved in cell wall biosynthesis